MTAAPWQIFVSKIWRHLETTPPTASHAPDAIWLPRRSELLCLAGGGIEFGRRMFEPVSGGKQGAIIGNGIEGAWLANCLLPQRT